MLVFVFIKDKIILIINLNIKWCPVMHNVPSTFSFKGLRKITPSSFGVNINSANSITRYTPTVK